MRFEMKRLFGSKVNLIIFAIFFCVKFVFSWLGATPADDLLYREYMSRYSGIYTVENERKLQAEEMHFRTVFDMSAQMYEAYMQDRISHEEYMTYTKQYAKAEAHLEVIPDVLERMKYLKNRVDEAQVLASRKKAAEQTNDNKISQMTALQLSGYERPAEMFYQIGWEAYIGENRFDFLLYMLILILLVPYFSKDYESGMIALIHTSRHSASVKSMRVILSLFLCAGLIVVFRTLDYVTYAVRLGLPNGEASIQSLTVFSSYTGVMSLQAMLLTSLLFQILGAAALILVIYGAANILKNTVFVALCYFVLVFFPYLDYLTLHLIPGAARKFLFPAVLSGFAVFSDVDAVVIMGMPVSSPVVSGMFFLTLCTGAVWALRRHVQR
jgi:hypothetical protein